jgi:GTP cyclohydrolase II
MDDLELGRRLLGVERALGDLRRGVPVVLTGRQDFVSLPVETLTPARFGVLAQAASASPLLLLAASTHWALRPLPAAGEEEPAPLRAFALTEEVSPDFLRALACPSFAAEPRERPPLRPHPLPAEAPGLIGLAKLARLAPLVLAAPLGTGGERWAEERGWLKVLIEDVLAFPALEAASLERVAEAEVPLAIAPATRLVAFRPAWGGIEHLAIVIGAPEKRDAPLVRLHSACLTGDLLGSLRCDCGPQLQAALAAIAAEGDGVVLYLAQEGRGIGLVNKLRAYALQDSGLDTLEANLALGFGADERRFLLAAALLRALGLPRIRLLTNNPEKVAALEAYGIEITARLPLVIPPNGINDFYLATKARRFGHHLPAAPNAADGGEVEEKPRSPSAEAASPLVPRHGRG